MSGEVFKQLVVTRLLSAMNRRGLTPKLLAKELKTTQARVDALLNVSDYNLDLRLFLRACQHLKIRVRFRSDTGAPKPVESVAADSSISDSTSEQMRIVSANFLRQPSAVQH